MLTKIQKNKKQIENTQIFNIFNNSYFFILTNKKSGSFQEFLAFEQMLKKEKNIGFKNFKKGSLLTIMNKTIFKKTSQFLEGSLFLI